MYGIYANIWGKLMVNVTIYSIHGTYGKWISVILCIVASFFTMFFDQNPFTTPHRHFWVVKNTCFILKEHSSWKSRHTFSSWKRSPSAEAQPRATPDRSPGCCGRPSWRTGHCCSQHPPWSPLSCWPATRTSTFFHGKIWKLQWIWTRSRHPENPFAEFSLSKLVLLGDPTFFHGNHRGFHWVDVWGTAIWSTRRVEV